MKEELLHTIWKYKLIQQSSFIGTKGETIDIVSIGEHNQHSGPDFFASKIMINGIQLVGNVEIHIKTSDWLKHKHQDNKAYDNLILHIVYEHDVELEQNKAFNVSVLELKKYILPELIQKYSQLQVSNDVIACGKSIATIPEITWYSWLNRLAIERIEQKTNFIENLFHYTKQDYEQTLYILLLKNFGFKINNDAFELLAKSLPQAIIKKHLDNALQIEALLFGVTGFLEEPFSDKYPQLLQNEFDFLKHKYELIPLQKEIWKFSKTRPVNFPTIRIAQLAGLLTQAQSLFHLLETKADIKTLAQFFNITTNKYWETHFKFDTEAELSTKTFGESAFQTTVINTIIPFLFLIAQKQDKIDLSDYALDLLSNLPSEINHKTKAYTRLGIKNTSALESQAQIHLHDEYCSKKACLQCSVGQVLLKTSK